MVFPRLGQGSVMETSQVFLSHTSDMARFPAGRSFVQAALDAVVRAAMVPADMRYFAARDGRPADYCRERVADCDVYVAIVGFRYGSMVPGEAVSYTELEFDAASTSGRPRLVFLLEQAAGLSPRLADADPRPVEGFRQRLREAGLIVKTFTSAAELELELFQALTAFPGPAPTTAGPGSLAIGQPGCGRAGRPVRLAPRPAFLAGREDLLAGLHGRLAAGGAGTGPRVAVLCGLGGVGKTSVAVEYAHRQLGGLGLVWQVPAEDPAAMAASLGELAAQLGARDPRDARDPVLTVHAALADRPGGWLLIFDNAPDAAAVQAVLPPAGDGRVIITSRSPHWPGAAVEVPVLDPGAAAAFLSARTGGTGQAAAAELARELGGLPLALEQAAAYATAAGLGLAGYLTAYRDRAADLLDRGDPVGYDQRVTATWSLSFTRLRDDSPAAAGLLNLLACCAPDAVPYRILLQPAALPPALPPGPAAGLAPLLADDLAVGDAIAALRRYSLISPPGGGLVSVHRLVQAITLSRLPAGQAAAWREAAAALITAALPPDPQQPAAWPAFAALLPSILAALPPAGEAAHRAAVYLGYSGSHAAARDLHRQVLAARQHDLGADHPDTLASRAEVAYWTGNAGDPAAARDQYAALLPVRERISGADHDGTLTDRANLARWTGEAGDPAAARDQYAALLPDRERVCGTDHRDTLTDRANLAYYTGQSGDPAAARDEYARLLPVSERVLGADHPETLTTRANLARWTGEAGDPAAARDQSAVLLPVRERACGPEHPGTLATRANLARWTGEAGDPAAARDQLAVLLPVREKVSGPRHPDTLIVRSHLACYTGHAGDPAAARDQLAVLLPVRERVSGTEHPDTVMARAQLAHWASQADYQAAERQPKTSASAAHGSGQARNPRAFA
jgi:Domain of unknown function (DUF4062)/Tetratricopeptide repeat